MRRIGGIGQQVGNLTLEMLLGLLAMGSVPGYFVLQPWTLARLRHGWRIAAAAPLVIAVPAALWCLIALAQGSNLWPLVFILFAPAGCLYLLALVLIREIGGWT